MDFHQPVLVNEVLALFKVEPGLIFIDATLGNGGHTLEILKRGGIVYGIDQDPLSLNIATERISASGFSSQFFPINANFSQLDQLIGTKIPKQINGLLFDLGLNSGQQKSTGRGFSFNDQESLDMRLDPQTQELTGEEIINTYSFNDLYDIFSKLAQEKYSKPLIIRIISERQHQPIKSGQRLGNIIRQYYLDNHIKTVNDPATKVFMALRIVVNHEFENLRLALKTSLSFNSGCTVIVISFHSGEDRIVKQFIRKNFPRFPNKTISPTSSEILKNPLSRSAILRSYKIV